MQKSKFWPLVLAVSLLLTLCACGKSEEVKSVEKLIAGIGEVTFESEIKITEAENAYNNLIEEDQQKVENYNILLSAKEQYKNLGIKLTRDNYEKYLAVDFNLEYGGKIDAAKVMGYNIQSGNYVYTEIELNARVSGKSPNYDYNDVTVTVSIQGDYLPFTYEIYKKLNSGAMSLEEYAADYKTDVNKTLILQTDILGVGEAQDKIILNEDMWTLDKGLSLEFEVVDVSGTMTTIR
ncbi:hypothetical protein [Neglectibacter caecimuris]|uniref:hypothetical protein n=1 Tax=Neglectibacter caecimuris TaxID=3093658 RepID=UPI002AC8CF7C|nr:hypothetical protein [Neglectibacter sp. M00184]